MNVPTGRFILLAVALLVVGAAHAVEVDGRFELTLRAQPDDVVFTSPAGEVLHVGAFRDGALYRVRFSPNGVGRWRYRARGAGRDLASGSFDATPRRGHGRVRTDGHRFVFSDGTPFYALGENRFNVYEPRWNYENRSIEQYLQAMHAAGMTTLRIFMINDCEDEEAPDRVQKGCLEPAPGKFSATSAALYDRIIDAAERDDLYVILCPWSIGFTQNETWKSWDDNPYSRTRGGPAASPTEFFTRGDLRGLEARKLEYIAARWGYSPHLLAIDVLNEPEWDGPIPEATWIPWAEAMARKWRKLDIYGHLVTAGSVGLQFNIGGSDERSWYASPENDLVEWHLYGKETYEVHALAATMNKKTQETWQYGKPILVGEFGYGGEAKPLYDHTHVGIWTAAMSGAGALVHSAPPFNLDSDEPMTPERARHLAGLSRFLRSLSPVAHTPATLAASPAGTRALALRSDDEVALWLLAPEAGYGAPVDGARVTVPALAAGAWRVRFVDELSGATVAERRVTVGGDTVVARAGTSPKGTLVVDVPRFSRHIAALITRDHPSRD